MTQIEDNNKLDNKLNLILTNFGIERIAQAVEEPTTNLNITKIRLGSGENNKYYDPDPSQTELKGDLGLEFYIYDKELLEDNLTVSFHTIIPEDFGGFYIREVGLYESFNGEDKLFAISTQQPFVKPSSEYNYFINIDYYIFLKAQNLATVYDQIILDVEHAQITEAALEELMRTFLFAQGNLINQIGNNSEIIGYNRASQLYEKIEENKKTYSYITLYKNFASLTDVLDSPEDIFSYWVFDYSRRKEILNSIVDISKNGYYMSTSVPINNFNRIYKGFTSMFTFDGTKSFSLTSQIPLNLYDTTTNMDAPFSMIFVVEPLETETTRTLLAKSDYARRLHSLEVVEMPDSSIQVRLFSDPSNYLTFRTVQDSVPTSAHSIVLNYNPTEKEMTFYINSTKYVVEAEQTGPSYYHIAETSGLLYAFDCSPKYSIWATGDYVEAQNPQEPPQLPLFFKDEYGNFSEYSGDEWEVVNDKIYYNNHEAELDSSVDREETPLLYAWVPIEAVTYDEIVYTKVLPEDMENFAFNDSPVLYDSTYREYEGENFNVEQDDISGKYFIKFYRNEDTYSTSYDENFNVNPRYVYFYTYTMDVATIYTNDKENPSVLYTKTEDDTYVVYTGEEWTIFANKIYRLGQLAEYNEDEDVNTGSPDLTSYIIDSSGYPKDYINSNVGLISIIKKGLTDENARVLALNLCATLGKNPYIGGF